MQFGASEIWQTVGESEQEGTGPCSYREKRESWEGPFPRIQSGNGFSLAECVDFSLAEMLLGKEKIFLLPAGVVE